MNKDYLNQDTIVAISSAQGTGGIAVIRMSGTISQNILNKIFKRPNNKSVYQMESHKLYRGYIVDSINSKIDDVLSVYMKLPNSYTGEDIIEIHSHGGILIPKIILEQCLLYGARLSSPGEFTYRAYINGKMDLLQAEAVADIIKCQTETALKQSQTQLEGRLSARIKYIKEMILDLLSEVEANVDFPEEEIDTLIKDTMIQNSNSLIDNIKQLLSTYNTGNLIKNGLCTAIIGKPNVGKSSLLNNLIGKQRAIVSKLPGTTRDFIEESIDIKGIPLKLIDTAGMRKSSDKIEITGINIAKQKIKQAELVLAVLDSSDVLSEEDHRVLKYTHDNKSIVVLNKCDLPAKITPSMINNSSKSSVIKISAKYATNIEQLKDQIYTTITDDKVTTDTNGILISELRHKLALEKALKSLIQFISLLEKNESPEYLSIDLRYALDSLSEIIGEISTEELLGKIFSKFCIGK